jgi:hypothetical protein
MKSAKLALASLFLSNTNAGQSFIDWDKHIYDEEEYFKDIPDMIDV